MAFTVNLFFSLILKRKLWVPVKNKIKVMCNKSYITNHKIMKNVQHKDVSITGIVINVYVARTLSLIE